MNAAGRWSIGSLLLATLLTGCSTAPVGTTIAIGQPTPDIVGNDTTGQEMKLSDYRGQVVMLDFWGDW